MQDKWSLVNTANVNQMLRVKELVEPLQRISYPNLIIITHEYHMADDIMFPDPACLAFFTAFEDEHLKALEEQKELVLSAVDIKEGSFKFFIYCDDAQKCVHDCISFLKSNPLYVVDFKIYNDDNFTTYDRLVGV